jgi:hypothetical protein
MRKVLSWVFLIFFAAVIYKAATWSYQASKTEDPSTVQGEVFDVDKDCSKTADTGACICRHKRSGERLNLPHSECEERARNNR